MFYSGNSGHGSFRADIESAAQPHWLDNSPPADWDVRQHILASLVITNKPGDYPLQPAWVGSEMVTAYSGYFKTEYERSKQTNRWLRFDRLTVCPGPIFPIMREDRYIWNTATGWRPGPAYRRSLPADSELLRIRDVASVAKFFGFNPFKGKCSAFVACYYTLGPYNSIQTINVMFEKGKGSNIEGIIVRRCHLTGE